MNLEPFLLLVVSSILLAFSRIGAYEPATWWMEVAPVFIAFAVLAATYRRFPLTPLAYRLIFIHSLILMLGGHYTYARVPLGFWIQDLFHLARNHYDRLGHFAQGFIPAIIAREVLLRNTPLRKGGWLFFLVTCICLSVSACYEFVEWWAALLGGEGAESFLGTQGDPWDTQWDMFLAFIGSMISQALLLREHDRELEHVATPVVSADPLKSTAA